MLGISIYDTVAQHVGIVVYPTVGNNTHTIPIRSYHLHVFCSVYARDVLSVNDTKIANSKIDTRGLWKTTTVRLPEMSVGQLIFQYTKGKPHQSGVALDDVRIVPCDYDTISHNHTIEINVESGVCNIDKCV